MKSPAFDYIRAESPQHAFELLARHGDDARVIAGGQTLLATLNMRLSQPALLVDIAGFDAWRGIAVDVGVLRIGALTRHSEVESSPLVATHAPLLAQAAPHIGHRAIRNLGTIGGSVAYADPAAEWPACLVALDGTVVVQGRHGRRQIAARDLFLDLYTTARHDDEVLVECAVPLRRPNDVHVFDELARRRGDYAIVGLALAGQMERGALHRPRLALLGVGNVPVRAKAAEAVLEGRPLDDALVASAVAALRAELQPHGDLVNGPATKRHLAGVLAERALRSLLATHAPA